MFPGESCDACTDHRHHDCTGWTEGWCGCTSALCGLRLLTGVMWDITEPDEPTERGDL